VLEVDRVDDSAQHARGGRRREKSSAVEADRLQYLRQRRAVDVASARRFQQQIGMATGKIVVVEDERIVARDLEATLTRLGYSVCAVVSSGEEAIQQAEQCRPDLVLMDIVLKGRVDGVEATRIIRERFDIPVIYLTAYADDATFQRAKATLPASYLFKPFKERELRIAVELAIYNQMMRQRLRRSEEPFLTTADQTDAVILTDERGVVTFLNPAAERLTGRKLEEAFGKKIDEVCPLLDQRTQRPVEHPVGKVLDGGSPVELADHGVAVRSAEDRLTPVVDGASPIRDSSGQILRVVLVVRAAPQMAAVAPPASS
jgi:PAS domain S-box-containing protein